MWFKRIVYTKILICFYFTYPIQDIDKHFILRNICNIYMYLWHINVFLELQMIKVEPLKSH